MAYACACVVRVNQPATTDRRPTANQQKMNESTKSRSVGNQEQPPTDRPPTDQPLNDDHRRKIDRGAIRDPIDWVSLIFFPNRARPKAPRGVWPEWRRSEIEHRAESRQLTGQLLNDDRETENRCKATRDGPPIERQSNKTQRLDRMSIDKRPKADEKSIGVRSGTGHLSIDRRIRGSGSIEYRSINDRKPMISRSEWDQGRTT